MFKELEVSGTGVLFFYVLIALLIIGLIYFFRRKYSAYTLDQLKQNNQDVKNADLGSRTKFPEVDNFKLSNSFINFGIASAMAISLVTMSWTIYEKKIAITDDMLDFDDEVEVEIPRTAEPPPPPPPPPPPLADLSDFESTRKNTPTPIDMSSARMPSTRLAFATSLSAMSVCFSCKE
jgi:protein TonB